MQYLESLIYENSSKNGRVADKRNVTTSPYNEHIPLHLFPEKMNTFVLQRFPNNMLDLLFSVKQRIRLIAPTAQSKYDKTNQKINKFPPPWYMATMAILPTASSSQNAEIIGSRTWLFDPVPQIQHPLSGTWLSTHVARIDQQDRLGAGYPLMLRYHRYNFPYVGRQSFKCEPHNRHWAQKKQQYPDNKGLRHNYFESNFANKQTS